jgi:hypothetical protein
VTEGDSPSAIPRIYTLKEAAGVNRTYSLAEAAAQICGDSMKNPELWLRRRMRDGTITGVKVGRHVRMTEQQITDALAALEIGGARTQEPARRLGITAASLRRRSA